MSVDPLIQATKNVVVVTFHGTNLLRDDGWKQTMPGQLYTLEKRGNLAKYRSKGRDLQGGYFWGGMDGTMHSPKPVTVNF